VTGDVGSLVVVHGGEPVGIITESDVVAVAAARGDTDALTVGDVMSEDLVTVDPDASVEAAVESLRAHDVEKLPVLEDGTLVGIVTTTDVADYVPRDTWTTGDPVSSHERHRFTRPDTAYENEEWDFESYGTEGRHRRRRPRHLHEDALRERRPGLRGRPRATRTASTSTRRTPRGPASVGGSPTGRWSRGSSAPRSPGSPDSPSTSHRK